MSSHFESMMSWFQVKIQGSQIIVATCSFYCTIDINISYTIIEYRFYDELLVFDFKESKAGLFWIANIKFLQLLPKHWIEKKMWKTKRLF